MNTSNDTGGTTPISPDEAAALIPNLSTREELNEWERENILAAHRWGFAAGNLKRNDPLTEAYLRQLHRRMFDHTWKWAGAYRNTNKNIGVNFGQVMEMLGALLADARYWLAEKTYAPDEIAARFHHRLVWIHPFPNGNGRHSRLMADVLLARGKQKVFSWGSINLKDAGAVRSKYIAALKAADAGDLTPLLKFVRS
jgi:Fic-DOC domain mobile mystery protein B